MKFTFYWIRSAVSLTSWATLNADTLKATINPLPENTAGFESLVLFEKKEIAQEMAKRTRRGKFSKAEWDKQYPVYTLEIETDLKNLEEITYSDNESKKSTDAWELDLAANPTIKLISASLSHVDANLADIQFEAPAAVATLETPETRGRSRERSTEPTADFTDCRIPESNKEEEIYLNVLAEQNNREEQENNNTNNKQIVLRAPQRNFGTIYSVITSLSQAFFGAATIVTDDMLTRFITGTLFAGLTYSNTRYIEQGINYSQLEKQDKDHNHSEGLNQRLSNLLEYNPYNVESEESDNDLDENTQAILNQRALLHTELNHREVENIEDIQNIRTPSPTRNSL